MESNPDRSLVPQPSRELAVPQIARNRILGEMVAGSLEIARDVAPVNIDLDDLKQALKLLVAETRTKLAADLMAKLDLLVQEAKRLQVRGPGTEEHPNNVRAFQLFLRAAEGGHPEGQYEVATCFGWGDGVPMSDIECNRWMILAAEQGHVEAQSMLGMFRLGESEEAAKWLRMAAEQGDVDSQLTLGLRLIFGKGVPQDDCEGNAWLSLAKGIQSCDWRNYIAAVAPSLSSEKLEKAHELYQAFKRKYTTKQEAK